MTEVGTADLATDGTGDPSVSQCHVDVLLQPVPFLFAKSHALITVWSQLRAPLLYFKCHLLLLAT